MKTWLIKIFNLDRCVYCIHSIKRHKLDNSYYCNRHEQFIYLPYNLKCNYFKFKKGGK